MDAVRGNDSDSLLIGVDPGIGEKEQADTKEYRKQFR